MRPPAPVSDPLDGLLNRPGPGAFAMIRGKTGHDRRSSYSLVTPVMVMWPIMESSVAPCQ